MKRHVGIRFGGAALVLLALLTVSASSAIAGAAKCMVINDRINTTYLYKYPKSTQPVQDAIDDADSWDTLWIRGRCPGPVEITKSLTLEGQEIPGLNSFPTIINPYTPPSSVVHVSGNGVQVQINSLILTGGGSYRFPVGKGGGIWNEQAELTLDDVTITGNDAYEGAGIYNDGGTVQLTDSTIDSNLAGMAQVPGVGGGIYTINGTVILNASTITNNQFAKAGGGIYARASTVVANGSEIAHNYTDILYNGLYPERGGGIYIYSPYPERWSTLTLADTMIHDNFATLTGGGIYASRADVTLTGSSELSGNHADRIGGGAYVRGNLVLSGDTTIHDNTAFDLKGLPLGVGGGVLFDYFNYSDRFTMSGNAAIYDNMAFEWGGGIDGPSGYLINCIEGVNVFDNLPDDIHPPPP